MADSGLLIDLLLILGVAFVLGTFMQRIGQPVILGYLIAGLVLGPGLPGPVVDPFGVDLLANLGVTLLMFSLGVQFSFRDLFDLRRIVSIGGGVQIGLTMLIGSVASYGFGFGFAEAFVIGAVVAITSSTVALKLLQLRGEMNQPHARATLGVSLAQDLAVVPLIALLPALTGASQEQAVLSLLQSLGLAALVLITLWLLGLRLVPWLLYQIARLGSRELFLVTIILIAFGVAFLGEIAGLSLAFGAFLAGVVVSESEFSHQVLGEIIPLRDVFAVVFFASIGLLFDPSGVLDDWTLILGLLVLILIVKIFAAGVSIRLLGFPAVTAASAAVLLGQIGEFSFILAGQAIDLGVIDDRIYNAILAGAIVSLLVNPMLIRLTDPLSRLLALVPTLPVPSEDVQEIDSGVNGVGAVRNHTIIAGFGRAGRELARALQRRGLRFVVIDLDPVVVRALREREIPAIYGDIGNENVLQAAGVEHARVLAVTIQDLIAAQLAIRIARNSNESLDVIAMAQSPDQIRRLDEAGATEIVQPAFEVGLEFVRHTLHRSGLSMQEIQAQVSSRRLDYYDPDRQDDELT
ncbi:MAG: cation:proton antiporter [Thermomicrobiaceae bacterium]